MGEIAEMMLDGTLCEGCGSYIDDDGAEGMPRYCSPQCARDRGAATGDRGRKKRQIVPFVMRKQDRRWLERVAMESNASGPMYAGMRADFLPSGPSGRLRKAGLIRSESPHNPVHKDRWVITDAGRMALEQSP